jgi:hypothetical protein
MWDEADGLWADETVEVSSTNLLWRQYTVYGDCSSSKALVVLTHPTAPKRPPKVANIAVRNG